QPTATGAGPHHRGDLVADLTPVHRPVGVQFADRAGHHVHPAHASPVGGPHRPFTVVGDAIGQSGGTHAHIVPHRLQRRPYSGAVTQSQDAPASTLLVIAAGGAAGASLRHLVAVWVPSTPAGWPWATWLVNLLGALLMGVLMGLLATRPATAGTATALLRPFLG